MNFQIQTLIILIYSFRIIIVFKILLLLWVSKGSKQSLSKVRIRRNPKLSFITKFSINPMIKWQAIDLFKMDIPLREKTREFSLKAQLFQVNSDPLNIHMCLCLQFPLPSVDFQSTMKFSQVFTHCRMQMSLTNSNSVEIMQSSQNYPPKLSKNINFR